MTHVRIRVLQILTVIVFGIVICRLFYWQVISRSRLQTLARDQYQSIETILAGRGEILSSDGYPLVTNQPNYVLYAIPSELTLKPEKLAAQLTPYVWAEFQAATSSAVSPEEVTQILIDRLTAPDKRWIALAHRLDRHTKEAITQLKLAGIGFDEGLERSYPEASMAAQLLGFVGSDAAGRPTGYFGLEGYYNLELTGRPGLLSEQTDVSGRPMANADYSEIAAQPGRTLITAIDRGAQLLAEKSLVKGMQKYGAKGGDISIMDPKTGQIIALAGTPTFDPAIFWQAPTSTYKLPSIADSFEPGSIFKTVVMAAAIDSGRVKPLDICETECSGPVIIGPHTIRTWNNEYFPGENVGQILERSDNVGMVFVVNRLGKNSFIDYLDRFGIGQPTYIDLEGESTAPLRDTWGDIDVATAAFGQGLAVTSIRMLTTVGIIASGGKLYEPRVVAAVVSGNKSVPVEVKYKANIIKPETVTTLTEMMVASAAHGEAKWSLPSGYRVAGKTGTAQIPISGHYDPEKTIASFIGFAPADNPRFMMLVKLKEPSASPWASETAAPLWFDLAGQLLRYYNVPPQLP